MKHFLKHASNKRNYLRTIPDSKDVYKTISDNCEKQEMLNTLFTSVFRKEVDRLPEFHKTGILIELTKIFVTIVSSSWNRCSIEKIYIKCSH